MAALAVRGHRRRALAHGFSVCCALGLGMACAWGKPAHAPSLTAEEIVAKNVAARGGLEAWRKIQTMVWIGHMEVPGGPDPRMGFVLEQKRPDKTRFEITTMNARMVRVFDGRQGWKVRPSQEGGGIDAKPFSPDEVKFSQRAQGIDGPLMDYQSKGVMVSLAGEETIEGRKTYKLAVRLPAGEGQDIWIDAKTFLDVKYDRLSYGPSGTPGRVSVVYRDYQSFEGLTIPTTMEIGVGSKLQHDKMVIEKVVLNAPLDDDAFGKPGSHHRTTAGQFKSNRRGPVIAPPLPASSPDSGSARQ